MIRKYEAQDLQECRALWRELTEWHREIYQDPSIGGEAPELKFDEHLALVGPNQIWVAVEQSSIVGLIGMNCSGHEAEVEPIVVTKSYRDRGVGKQLLKAVIDEARRKNIRLLTVKPVARNVSTVKFLHGQGFRNVGFIELFMDLSNRSWKPSLEIFECNFNY
jgi:N-acetylglutamate synthase-like GNAT family acetyltransferase